MSEELTIRLLTFDGEDDIDRKWGVYDRANWLVGYISYDKEAGEYGFASPRPYNVIVADQLDQISNFLDELA